MTKCYVTLRNFAVDFHESVCDTMRHIYQVDEDCQELLAERTQASLMSFYKTDSHPLITLEFSPCLFLIL